MQTTHTPGPWTYNQADGLIESECGSPIAIPQNEKPGKPLVDPDTMHANARLIASAPDLLEALKNLCECEDHQRSICCEQFVDNSYAKARAAISRATGGQP